MYAHRVKVVTHHAAYWATLEVWCGKWECTEYLTGMGSTIDEAIQNLKKNMEWSRQRTKKLIDGISTLSIVDGNDNVLKEEQ